MCLYTHRPHYLIIYYPSPHYFGWNGSKSHHCLKFNVVSNQKSHLGKKSSKIMWVEIKIIWIYTHHEHINVCTFICIPVDIGQDCYVSTTPLCVFLAYEPHLLWIIAFLAMVSLKWEEILKILLKQFECRILRFFFNRFL